eukprot:4146620-Ditylum_brightwellii.AAC.1
MPLCLPVLLGRRLVEGDEYRVGEVELMKNQMSWSVIVLVRQSAVLPESEYSQDCIAKNRAPMRRIA